MALARMLRSLERDEDGSALVEGAVVFPLLLLVLFGVYEFSWFFYQQHVVSTGLRDAARYVARATRLCGPAAPGWGVIEINARNLATSGTIFGGAERVHGWTPVMVTLTCSEVDNAPDRNGAQPYRGGPLIAVVTASTRFSDPSLGFFRILGLSPPTLAASHSERVIGPG
jgi:hypothetical protein